MQKLSHLIEFRQVGWLGRFASSNFWKISRWKADWHNISAYKKSSRYLKALKSYPILKFGRHNDDDNNDDSMGGYNIAAEFHSAADKYLMINWLILWKYNILHKISSLDAE